MLHTAAKRDASKKRSDSDRVSPSPRVTSTHDALDRLGNTAILRMLRGRALARSPAAIHVQRQTPQVVPQPPTVQPPTVQPPTVQPPTMQPPASAWNFSIPYIHFDLLDFYASLFYSAYTRLGGDVNHNFAANLHPGPVRTPANTRSHGGFAVTPGELEWVFYTKFYIDSASAPFPGTPSQLRAAAHVRYETLDHRVLFDRPFEDRNPRYLSPLGTHPYYLSTTPFMFRTSERIQEEGDLTWDAELELSTGHTEPGVRIEPQLPLSCLTPAALMTGVRGLVPGLREAAPGQPAWVYRVSITPAASGVLAHIDLIRPDGQPGGQRDLTGSCASVARNLPLVIAIAIDFNTDPARNNMGTRTLRGTQRVPFRNPSPTP